MGNGGLAHGADRGPRIVLVGGTRPEAIKLAPLVERLAADGHAHRLVATGQHGALFHAALADFGLTADEDLALPNDDAEGFAAATAAAVPRVLRRFDADLLLVQGDTSSAVGAARGGVAAGVAVGHVEAGLRAPDPSRPWPEEPNRREIDALAALLFAPSRTALSNLAGAPGRACLTGNTGIDALETIRARRPLAFHAGSARLVLVTCHRREAIPRLDGIATALLRLADRGDVDLAVPVHPNPAFAVLADALGRHPRIALMPPQPYPALIALMERAHLLLTDSGGLQEEAAALGLPTLVLRDETERPETIAAGCARLVGRDPARIMGEAARLLDDPAAHAAMARPAFPYGRGDAARRIVAAIARWWEERPPARPYRSASLGAGAPLA